MQCVSFFLRLYVSEKQKNQNNNKATASFQSPSPRVTNSTHLLVQNSEELMKNELFWFPMCVFKDEFQMEISKVHESSENSSESEPQNHTIPCKYGEMKNNK
jgi:hypothetical protein